VSNATACNEGQLRVAGDDHSGNYFSSNDQTPFQLVHGEVARN
jgi:hypothetical protein